MSILDTEIIWRKPQESSDNPTNGGRMTANQIVSAVKNNLWPDVSQAERTAGSIKYRKAFIHIANDSDLEMIDPKIFIETISPGDDSVVIATTAGGQTDQQSGIGTPNWFCGGTLNAALTGGETVITVAVEQSVVDAALTVFRDGDTIRLSDKATVAGAGNEEFLTIAAAGVSGPAGTVYTLTLTSAVGNAYAQGDKVAGVIEPGNIIGSYASLLVTTVNTGAYDDTTYPILVDSIGGIEQNWTITFTDGLGNFQLEGDIVGVVGTGSTGADLQPTNGDYSKPYFYLNSLGWSGSFDLNDTVTFSTSPASVPIWYRRDVPAGAASLSGDKVIVGIVGESA